MSNNLPAYVFDLDRTLIRKNSSLCFFQYLVERSFYPKSAFFPVLYYCLLKKSYLFSLEQLHEKVFSAFLEKQLELSVEMHARDFVDREFPRLLCPQIYPYLQEAKTRKAHTILLSSSPAFLVKLFAKKFGIMTWLGSTHHVDEKGYFIAIKKTVTGQTKREFLQTFLEKNPVDAEAIYGFSDSADDLPLLLEIPHVHVVRPDRKLKKISRKRHWKVL